MRGEDGVRDRKEAAGPPNGRADQPSSDLGSPFSGEAEGTFTLVLDEYGNPILCDAFEGRGVLMHLAGEGVMSHLGRITLSATHCSSPDPEAGQYAKGSAVYKAEDGDEMYAVYEQLGAPDDPAIEVIVGGTGRFRDASGEVRVRVVPRVASGEGGVPAFPGRFSATYTGWISFEATDRNDRGG